MQGRNPINRIWIALALVVALGLSARTAWQNRDAPQFGFLHDDGLYLVSAKSLAEGSGYKLESFPGSPDHTKYPPGYPFLLSLAWKLGGGYPGVLRWATLLGWLTIPVSVALSMLLFKRFGMSEAGAGLLGVSLTLNPYITLFGTSLLTESAFLCFLLVSFLLVAPVNAPKTFLSALAGAAAFLTRSAGIVLLLTEPVALILRRKKRAAAVFLCVMAPAVIAWMTWARLHTPPAGPDWILTYYTNYFAYQLQNTPISIFHIVLWKNLDSLMYSMGSLVFPKVFDLLAAKIMAQVISLAMIAGVIRLVRRVPASRDYAIFAAGSVGLLLIWHFPPTERFLLPLAPLLFAGLLTELEYLAGLISSALHKDVLHRIAATLMGAIAAVFLVGCILLQVWVGQLYMPRIAQQWRERRVERQPAYQWIRENTPADAIFVAYDDGPLYLETGRHAFAVPLPTRYWYVEDYTHQVDIYRNIHELARNHGARYVYYSRNDLDRDAAPNQRSAVERAMRDNVHLRPIWEGARSVIFEVREDAPAK